MRLDHEKVRWYRDRRGWTLDTLAEEASVAKGTVLRAEHGEDVRPSSGRRIAHALEVELSDLIPDKPGRVGELAGVGKVEAPRGAGQTEAEVEEERRVIPQAVSSLEEFIKDMKELKELREAELEEIGIRRGIGLRNALPTQMELADEGLRGLLKVLGVLDFAEAVRAGREMADPEAIPLCHELLRRLDELERLSAQARAASGVARAGIYIEDVKGPSAVPAWMHKQLQEQQSPES
jgi:transcriptional regulator with XRE-family HTH domain